MKKPIAILLVALMLFNAMGIGGLFLGLRYKSGLDLAQRLDDQRYSDTELVTLKVPLAVPYQVDSDEFKRVDGEVEHNGEIYRLVKQKLKRDTLYVMCIKDQDSKLIKQALSDYVKTFTDKPVDSKHTLKAFSGVQDFLLTSIEITHSSSGWNYVVVPTNVNDKFNSRAMAVSYPPPRG